MKSNVYLILKLVFLFTISSTFFYILEYGFAFDSWYKLITPLLLSVFITIMFYKPQSRRLVLGFAIFCLVLMVLISIFNILELANTVGSFGFSLLIVTIFLYLPQIIKKGHVERF